MSVYNTSTGDNTTGVNLDDLMQVKKKFDALGQKRLRSLSEVTETACPTCGRKPTVTNAGFGDTIVVCPCFWAALKRQVKPAPEPTRPPGMITGPPGCHSLGGLYFEVVVDGPSRF